MLKYKMLIIKISLVLVSVGGLLGLGFYLGHQSSDDVTYYESSSTRLEDNEVDILVEEINSKSEIVLVEETGITSVSLERYDKSWNSWLTRAKADIGVEYRVKVGIDSEGIKVSKTGDRIFIIVGDYKVISSEMLNQNVVLGRSVFANEYDVNEVLDIINQMMEKVESSVENSPEIEAQFKLAFDEYINNLITSLGVTTPVEVVYLN